MKIFLKKQGPVCWSDSCNGAYEHTCGLLCTLDKSSCASLIGGIAESALTGAMDIVTAVATLGTNIGALMGAYSSVASIGAALLNDVCANPNILQTQCIRPIVSGNLKSCSGINPKACGLFCTSSQMVCAKTIIELSSQISGVLGLVGGAMPNKKAEEAAAKISSKELKKLLDAIGAVQFATLDYDILQTFMEIMGGPAASGCIYSLKIIYFFKLDFLI